MDAPWANAMSENAARTTASAKQRAERSHRCSHFQANCFSVLGGDDTPGLGQMSE